MDESRKKTLAVCAAFIAAPRLMFLDEESPAALRGALTDAIRKAEILLSQVNGAWKTIRCGRGPRIRSNVRPKRRALALLKDF
jgi:hypothetical protein